ncbi:MAG: LytTR family DNA-binding domain-containing protein [Gammaproteobacteria bacterium]|nr:LytTR family DNA-binding domain-containing protein [Gammaproteobacteria bacterium]MBU1644801.1 LytTR family DNA-binding domain-containing protein [Gammaproteobacteria bacterium]MBU1973034.1 LytTR family DNA-binding domain-containing protein [Gammaproteobacteria bacterium]
MTKLRLLLVDDEAPARARLRDLLGDIAGELPNEVVAEAADGIAALERIEALPAGSIDIALIDIRMPRMDGIELAQHLGRLESPPAVIFATAFDQYAVKAFELNAIDYLLKPVRAERLAAALHKATPMPLSRAAQRQLAPEGRRHLRCPERGRVLLVPLAEVLYFKADQKYVTARTAEREFLLEESLAHLEEEFAARFVRIHRNCLVARDAVAGCAREAATDAAAGEADPHWALVLRGVPEHLPVSRRQWAQVKALLEI